MVAPLLQDLQVFAKPVLAKRLLRYTIARCRWRWRWTPYRMSVRWIGATLRQASCQLIYNDFSAIT